jgi:formate-dependent nitrite reductase cytochrome c552 subunit
MVVGVAVLVGIFAAVWALQAGESASDREASLETPSTTGDNSEKTGRDRFGVSIRKPDGPPRVLTGTFDAHGNAVTVSCSTCHTTRPPNAATKTSADLNEFHKGLRVTHGSVSCLACHNSGDYDALKLADGTRVEFSNVMTLCAQCHGPQMKDYEHGVHGGMNGYWDRNRGPQRKLNCVDCHHPHAPQFPKMRPTFKPKDRFLSP